tara:strand:- start:176 stop:1291 length:1116 start_codon:yes stop_codon:yes gene_type:complete
MRIKIPYVNLIKQIKEEKKEVHNIIDKVFSKGQFILGKEVDKFEKNICNLLGVKNCVALNSGTDALVLGLHLLGVKKNHEVITTPNSFIASTAAIVHLGAIPVFADVNEDQNIDVNEIKKKININTKAIMPVHLSGKPCEMSKIINLSKKYNIPIIEDAAQSIGTKYKNKYVGTFGKVGCFSAHPLKNLNAIGDSGYLVTNDNMLAKKARLLRNHGIEKRNKILHFGYVSRMDNLQAAVLNLRFKNLKKIIKKRRFNAKLYNSYLKKIKNIKIIEEKRFEFHTYHTYVILADKRNKLKKYLEKKGILTTIHYPKLIFEHAAYKKRFNSISKNKFPISKKLNKSILTLPINQYLKTTQIKRICEEIQKFYKK